MQTTSKASTYYPGLDGWRGLAILGVILSHSTGFLFSPEEKQNLLYRGFILGSNGVDLFFAISGFLICSKLLEGEAATNGIRLFDFYKKRIFRILPLYLTYLLFLLTLNVFSLLEIPQNQIFVSFIFLQNYQIPADAWHYALAHFWSLAVEEHFYLIFPIFLLLLPKNRLPQIVACVCLAALIAVWRFIDFRYHFLDSVLPNLAFFMRSDVRMDAILFGCIAALLFAYPRARPLLEKAFSLPIWGPMFLGIFLVFAIFELPFSLSIKGASAALLILCTVLQPRFFLFLEWAPLKWIGVMSYSLYVWNSFFLWPSYLQPVSVFGICQKFPLNFFCLFLVAYLSYCYIERPMISLGQGLGKRHSL
jgi:peptidoglycan/LPS O-acetylase OafA/YrhL